MKEPTMLAVNQVKTRLIGILLSLLIAVPVSAQTFTVGGIGEDGRQAPRTGPRVSLALSGGGARGIASIGVLKAFEERHIDIAALAGTSIGGVIGGLYACGYSPAKIENVFRSIDWGDIFGNRPDRRAMFLTQRQDRDRHLLSVRFEDYRPTIPKGITGGQKLISLLTALTMSANYRCGGDFDRLPVPFRTVSTDVVSGELIIIDSGSIADAMRATIAFPLAFTGFESAGRLLMDGGMLMPVPVFIARSLADSDAVLVAVNTTSPLQSLDELATPVHIANQVTTIMTADKMEAQLKEADLVVTPEIENYVSTDFDQIDSLIAIGYRAGLKAAENVLLLAGEKASLSALTFNRVSCDKTEHESLAHRLLDGISNRATSHAEIMSALQNVLKEIDAFEVRATMIDHGSGNGDSLDRELAISIAPSMSCADWKLVFSGMSIADSAEIVGNLPPCAGNMTRQWLDSVCNYVESEYLKRGFDLISVMVTSADTLTKLVRISVDEAIIERIDVANNNRTRAWLVRSLYSQKPGEPISSDKISRGISNIVGTDYFDRVSVHLTRVDNNPGGAIVEFDVDEKPHTQLRFGWHWDDEYKSEEFLELLDDNIDGIGLFGALHVQYADDRQTVYGLARMDRIVSTLLTATARVGYSRLQRRFFDSDGGELPVRMENRWSAELSLGRQIARLGAVSAKVTAERVSLDSLNSPDDILQIRKLSLVSQVETFDRLPFPTSGKQHLFTLESAGKILGGSTEYTRFRTSIEAYFPLTSRINYHPLIAVGLSRSNLPVSEKLYVGGLSQFAGFRTNQLAGDKLFLSSHELRSKVGARFYFAVRYDIGNVYAEADQISFESLRHGIGIWTAIETPIGPIVAGWGKANRLDDRMYINVGLDF